MKIINAFSWREKHCKLRNLLPYARNTMGKDLTVFEKPAMGQWQPMEHVNVGRNA